MLEVFQAETAEQYAEAGRLFDEYAAWLGFDLEFQQFSEELAGLPGPYAPPDGRLLLARADGRIAGCVALKRLEEGICEMKRLYVRPEFRGRGIGRVLAEKIIEMARSIGYRRMCLDTLLRPSLETARMLYRSLGFKPTGAYYHNPLPDVEYLELVLADESGQ